jgi:hypothetical protein
MERRFSIGWVLISYLMIAGGFMFAAVAVIAGEERAGWLSQGVSFSGAFVGGLFAGRASPGKIVAEPGLAGVLLILTVFGVCFAVPGGTDASFGEPATALKMAFVTGLGGFVGGLVGERTSRGGRPASAWHWWGVACLLTVGMTCLLVGLLALLVSLSGGSLSDSAAPLMAFAAFALGTFGGGFLAQAIAPRPMRAACGAGAVGIMVFFLAVNAGLGSLTAAMLVGAAILGIITSLIGAAGAGLSWRLIGARRAARLLSPDLPEARLR